MQFAKKKYGQHFLVNMNLVEQIAGYIIDAAGQYTKNVLEIGPGRGVLTKYLKQHDINLKVVEIDEDMVEVLLSESIVKPEQIIKANILKVNLREIFDGEPFILAGNFPYNISSQIVIQMLYQYDLIPAMVGMFQREMADRVLETEGTKSYSKLSVLTQAKYTGKRLIKISPGSFNPPPKVHSAVIRLDRKKVIKPIFKEKLFKTVVGLAFSQRRKMMKNTLKSLIFEGEMLQDEMLTRRPEQMTIEDFGILTNKILLHKNES